LTDYNTAIVGGLLGIGGTAVGFIANYVVERFRRRGTMNDARRRAYAEWFTREAFIQQRIAMICERLVGFPRDPEKHSALTAEVSLLADDVRALVTATNEAFLSEKRRSIRNALSISSDFLIEILATLDFAARHYGENLEFHELFGKNPEEIRKDLTGDEFTRWMKMKEDFEEHDAECPFKSPNFRDKLSRSLANVHKNSHKLRSRVARKIAA